MSVCSSACWMHAGFLFTCGLFSLIGLAAFLNGCNPDAGQCFTYEQLTGTAYNYRFDLQVCTRCTHWSSSSDGTRSCDNWENYDCYDSWVLFHYGVNSTCELETGTTDELPSAQHKAWKYDIGDKQKLLRYKNDIECVIFSDGLALWYVGVAFLSLAALVLLSWPLAIYFDRKPRQRLNVIRSGPPIASASVSPDSGYFVVEAQPVQAYGVPVGHYNNTY